jgi:hypothetical protein
MTFATIDLLCPHCYKIHNGKCAKAKDSKAGRDDLSDIPMKERKKLFNALLEIEPRSNNLSLPMDKPMSKLAEKDRRITKLLQLCMKLDKQLAEKDRIIQAFDCDNCLAKKEKDRTIKALRDDMDLQIDYTRSAYQLGRKDAQGEKDREIKAMEIHMRNLPEMYTKQAIQSERERLIKEIEKEFSFSSKGLREPPWMHIEERRWLEFKKREGIE